MNNQLRKLASLLASRRGTNRRNPALRAISRFTLESFETRTLLAASLVKDISSEPNPTGSNPTNMTEVNGIAFFTANARGYGVELWKTDGTVAGTVMVRDIRSGSGSATPENLTNVNGTL